MNILVAAGGTGGHIYPGIAISDRLKDYFPDAKITFVGTHVGMEKDIVPKRGYDLELTRARGFEKGVSAETFQAVKGIFDSLVDVRKILKKYKPDLVIGTGGFTSAALLFVASLYGIPTMIHEQNAYPGRSNRLTGKTVDKIGISFPQAQQYFDNNKTFLAGNPIRQEFKEINRDQAREKLGLRPEQKLIIIMGGSQGAQSINKAAIHMIKNIEDQNIVFYFLTGKDSEEAVKKELEDFDSDRVKIFGYFEDIPTLFAAGDLLISRSGASSIAEIAATGIPSILIPYPLAAGDHQTYNAKVLSDNGGAVLIPDQSLTGNLLLDQVNALLAEPNRLKQMAQATLEQKILDADDRFCKEAFDLVYEQKTKKKSAPKT